MVRGVCVEAGDSGMEKGNSQVGGGFRSGAGAVVGVDTSG